MSVSVSVWEGGDSWLCKVTGSMGANFCHLAAPRPPIEFLFWDHWDMAVLGQILAGRSREVTGGHGRSWEVAVGHGRLRRRKTEESGGTAGKRFEKNERI